MSTIQIHSRAKKGGELGANGEWYEGGKFINTVPENGKRQKAKVKATGKQEFESYKWAVAPAEGQKAIFRLLAGIEMPDRVNGGFIFNGELRGFYADAEHVAQRKEWIALFNAGVRWI